MNVKPVERFGKWIRYSLRTVKCGSTSILIRLPYEYSTELDRSQLVDLFADIQFRRGNLHLEVCDSSPANGASHDSNSWNIFAMLRQEKST